MYQVDTSASALSTPTCTAADSKPAAAPAAAPVFIYVEAGSSSRCSSDSAADIPHYPCSLQQQPELADATAADDVTCHIQVAPAAATLAAAAKSKPPQLQFAECNTAAALAGLGDNMQQRSRQLHSLPATAAASAVVVATGGGEDGGKQSGWLRRVCSRLFACGAGGSLSRVGWFQDDVDGWNHISLVVASCRLLLASS
jgi:hypothetical protein